MKKLIMVLMMVLIMNSGIVFAGLADINYYTQEGGDAAALAVSNNANLNNNLNANKNVNVGVNKNTNNNMNRNTNTNANKNTNLNANTSVNANVNANTNNVSGSLSNTNSNSNVGNNMQAVSVITPREFLGVPEAARTQLLEYNLSPKSKFNALTFPWTYKGEWTRGMIADLEGCYFGCDTSMQLFYPTVADKGFIVIGTTGFVVGLITATAENPMELWANVAKMVLETGATHIKPVKVVSTFDTKSTGASFYLGGGLSDASSSGDTGRATSSGIGFGTATSKAIERVTVTFVLSR